MSPPPPQPEFRAVTSSVRDANEETPFSLTPSIFLPFEGFTPGDAPVLDQTQKLQRILQNLPEQQGLVRGNMMSMVEQRVENLRARAREELAGMEGDYEDDSGDPEERKRVRMELDAMFQRTKMPPKKDAKSEDFEVKPGESPYRGIGAVYPAPADGDVAMGGTGIDQKERTARMVWEGLSRDLQDVVDRAASEMEAYDRHAQDTMVPYRQAFERRTGRQVPAPVAIGISGGILRNRNEESPIDRDAFRRMSTSMSVVGLPAAPSNRSYEKMDDIARRGSSSKPQTFISPHSLISPSFHNGPRQPLSPARNAFKLLASNCANSSTGDTSAPQSCPKDFWFYTFILCFTFLLIQCIFVSITASTSHEARDTLIDELRNTPSHKLHRVLESKYINHIGIQMPELEHVERYPSVTFVEDPVTWKTTITVVEDLAWVVPVDEEEREREISKERGIMSEEEEVGLILRDLGLENDEDLKPRNGMRRSGDEPPAYDEEGEYALPRWRGHVNP